MKIPSDAAIPIEKLTQYLLVARLRNDKSKFLVKAGFTLENPGDLLAAIRKQVAENDAVLDRQDEYGTFYQVVGDLVGPNGILSVVTVWIEQAVDREIRFVTLKPVRNKS
ncbi:hypothetical protein GC175_31105 [bacterium]|nr:hypothetical protein [bacterium]